MRHCILGTCILTTSSLAVPGAALGDVLLDQPHDYRNAVESDYMGPALSAQFGDDFQPNAPVLVESVTFWMVATWAAPPINWSIAVHRSTDDHTYLDFAPEYAWFYHRVGPSSLVDLGPWNGDGELNLYEIRYDDLNLLLDPAESLEGTFWFSSFGHIVDRNLHEARWGTAGHGTWDGWFAWKKTIPWVHPGWRGFSFPDGSRTDLAMRIEGTVLPGPGTLAGLGLMLSMVGASRNRRREQD